MTHDPAVPTLHPVFDVEVRLGTLADHGRTRAGHRRVVPIVGGCISGEVDATIEPGGADWQVVRMDGAIEIDGRYSARTDDDELLYLQVHGVRSGSPDVLAALGRGESIDPTRYYFRTTLTIETSSARLSHLQDSLYVASCIRDADAVRYRAYRVG